MFGEEEGEEEEEAMPASQANSYLYTHGTGKSYDIQRHYLKLPTGNKTGADAFFPCLTFVVVFWLGY
jgi:hypothetical protein